jgi:hypothetical protein
MSSVLKQEAYGSLAAEKMIPPNARCMSFAPKPRIQAIYRQKLSMH